MKGVIKKWEDDRGFGFIQCDSVSGDVFAHISKFQRGYRRPRVGDEVTFAIEHKNGKIKAISITLLGVEPNLVPKKRNFKPLFLATLLFGAVLGFQSFSNNDVHESNSFPLPNSEVIQDAAVFNGEGKTHCSQMRSCSEAKFYIEHCPNTKMDGDGDGIPCERQWCVDTEW